MSESIRDRFDKSPRRVECASYCLRASNDPQPMMLDLQKRNGDSHAVSYGYVSPVKHELSVGVTVNHANYRVTLNGRNLDELYAALLQQVVIAITEQGELDDQPDAQPVVNRIQIEEL